MSKSYPVDRSSTKKYCRGCEKEKDCLPLDRPRKDYRRHSIDKAGRTWHGEDCPDCAGHKQYVYHRQWFERKALRKGMEIPREGRRYARNSYFVFRFRIVLERSFVEQARTAGFTFQKLKELIEKIGIEETKKLVEKELNRETSNT